METFGIIITTISVIISLIVLFRDLRQNGSLKKSIHFVKNYWLSLILIAAFFLGIGIFTSYKVFTGERGVITYYDFSIADEKQGFYNMLTSSYRGAENEIVITGRGFRKETEENAVKIKKLSRATEDAIHKGVDVKRIQITKEVSQAWCDTYATLATKYPNRFKVYMDANPSDLLNVSLIDPYGANPIVELLFEVEKRNKDLVEYKATTGVLIVGNATLAQNLYQQLSLRIKGLQQISPTIIKEIYKKQ